MKKKLIVAVLTGLLLSFGGCGAAETVPSGTPTDVEDTNAGISTDTQSTGEAGTTVDVQTPEVADVPQYLDVELNYFGDSCYEDIYLMYGHYNTICLNSREYPALSRAVDAYNQEKEKQSGAYLEELKQRARDEYQQYGAEMFMGPFVAEKDMYLRRADNRVLSVVESCYSYEGGAHGNQYYTAVNFDVATGENLELESVIKDMEGLPAALALEVHTKYPDMAAWGDNLLHLLQGYLTEYRQFITWTVDYQGVTFYFSDYELGAYADGTQEVTITYKKYPELLNEMYFADVEETYVMDLPEHWASSDLDLNEDGVTESVSVTDGTYNPGWGGYESFDVTVNGNTFTMEDYYYNLWVDFVKANGKNYLYVRRSKDNDYQTVSVFEITENSVEYIDDFQNSVSNFTNSGDFKVLQRIDLLSTYHGEADCFVGEDGMPVEKNGRYTISGEITLTSTMPITAELVDEAGGFLGSEYEFPAGTRFRLMTTDGSSYVDAEADDGQRCRFYTTSEWPPVVNGMDAESAFEMLYYAG